MRSFDSLAAGRGLSGGAGLQPIDSGAATPDSGFPTVAIAPGDTTLVPLTTLFSGAGESSGDQYAVVGDTSPEVLAAAPRIVAPGALLIQVAADAGGSTQLTVSRTNAAGQTTTATLVVNVSSTSSAASTDGTPGFSTAAFAAEDDSLDDDTPSPGSGIMTTVAGNGDEGYSGDNGLAADAELYNPNDVAVDAAGDLFIADTSNNVVREVDAGTGVITTVAGTGVASYNGDDIQATSAELNNPQGLLVSGNTLYIADSGNNRIRAVDLTTGIITTVAGDGTAAYQVDCTPTSAELDWPIGLAMDGQGDMFIADNGNNVVEEVTGLGGSSAYITTVAGVYTLVPPTYSGEGGPAISAVLEPGRRGCQRRRDRLVCQRRVQQRRAGGPAHRKPGLQHNHHLGKRHVQPDRVGPGPGRRLVYRRQR